MRQLLVWMLSRIGTKLNMSDYTQTDIGSGYNTAANINTELTQVETAVNSKGDKSGFTMTGDLDLNSNDLLNIATFDVDTLSISGLTVSIGANDSAGTGYRLLRVLNS